MPHDLQRGLAAGLDRCIAKPVDPGKLLGVICAFAPKGPTPERSGQPRCACAPTMPM